MELLVDLVVVDKDSKALDLEVLEHNQDNLTHQILQTTEVMVDQVLLLVVEAVSWSRSDNADGVHGKQLPQFAQPLAFDPPHPYTSQPRWETSGYYGGGGSTNPGNPNPLGGVVYLEPQTHQIMVKTSMV